MPFFASLLKGFHSKEFVTEDGLSGVLTLQLSTVRIEEAGYGKSSKTVTTTRRYPNLAGQDTEYIPKTIDEGGRTMKLKSNWRRLDRKEYTVPCMYTLAQRLANVQKSAMANGETLVIYEAFCPAAVQSAVRDGLGALIKSNDTVAADMKKASGMGYGQNWFIASGTSNHQAGLAVDITLAKGNPEELYEYNLDGTVYRKYGATNGTPKRWGW